MNEAALITIEGLDGAGKTTVIERIRRELPDVRLIHEPGGTRLGEVMRALLKGDKPPVEELSVSPAAERMIERAIAEASSRELSAWLRELLRRGSAPDQAPPETLSPLDELRLFNIARAELTYERITPWLNRGELLVCDRFTDSTLAYQGYGRGLELGLVKRESLEATAGIIPDLTILLKIDPETRLRRISSRGAADRIESAGDGFFERVARGFDQIAFDEPERVKVIDAEQSERKVARASVYALDRFLTSSGR